MKHKQKPTTLKKLVYDLRKVGAKVTVSLEDSKMPTRFNDDPLPVKMLIEESERVTKLGNKWLTAEVPNQVAAEMCLRQGWAYALAAAWMRCKIKGELLPEADNRKP